MPQTNLDPEHLKSLLKEALAETLQEQRHLLHEVFAEVLEDLAFAEAIREGQSTEPVSREEEVFRDQLWFRHPEMKARIRRAESDLAEGRATRTKTAREAQAFLDSLKKPAVER